MNPPFSIDGTTATHSADPRISSGIPWSGAASISSRTLAAAWIRSAALVSSLVVLSSASDIAQNDAITTRSRSFFISSAFLEVSPNAKIDSADSNVFLSVGRGELVQSCVNQQEGLRKRSLEVT